MPACATAGPAPAPLLDVLVLDPDALSARRIVRALEAAGHTTRSTGAPAEAKRLMAERVPAVVVLDVVLPGRDGLELVRRLRADFGRAIGLLVLSARAEPSDRVLGLRLGADDYVAKPCVPGEVVARAEAVARRLDRDVAATEPFVVAGGLSISRDGRRVTVAGRDVSLARREYDLLVFLARHPGQTFTRDQLMARVWGYAHYTDTATLSVHVRRLRTKVPPHLIETVRGIGYRFAAPAAAA